MDFKKCTNLKSINRQNYDLMIIQKLQQIINWHRIELRTCLTPEDLISYTTQYELCKLRFLLLVFIFHNPLIDLIKYIDFIQIIWGKLDIQPGSCHQIFRHMTRTRHHGWPPSYPNLDLSKKFQHGAYSICIKISVQQVGKNNE